MHANSRSFVNIHASSHARTEGQRGAGAAQNSPETQFFSFRIQRLEPATS